MKKPTRHHVTLLIMQDKGTEPFTLRLPAYLFHFLIFLFVCVIIGAGLATVWLGEITVRLQAMDVVNQENRRLRTQLAKADQLQDELLILEDREHRILNLTQAFLDDTAARTATASPAAASEIYDDAARSLVITGVLGRERDLLSDRIGETKSALPPPLTVLSPVPHWKCLRLPASLEPQFQGAAAKPLIVPAGFPVLSPVAGIITAAAWDPVLGLTVTVHDAGGYAITLGHLGELTVRKGDFVRAGSPIGRTIMNGGETASYLLLRLERLSLAIDPDGVLIQ